MKIFRIDAENSVICNFKKTRNGFKHTAVMQWANSWSRDECKVCYLNRTWESYEYQTVLHKMIDRHYEVEEAASIKARLDAEALGEVEKSFRGIAMLGRLADVLTEKPEEQNMLKEKVVFGVPGMIKPDDWDILSTEEKARRMNGVLDMMEGGVK